MPHLCSLMKPWVSPAIDLQLSVQCGGKALHKQDVSGEEELLNEVTLLV